MSKISNKNLPPRSALLRHVCFARRPPEKPAGVPKRSNLWSRYFLAHSAPSPRSMSSPWGRSLKKASRLSCTALGLPGRLTIRVLPRMAATPRGKHRPAGDLHGIGANGFCNARHLPLGHRQGGLRGVWSRGVKPVPPVVRIRSSWRWSHRRMSCAFKGSGPSGSSSVSALRSRPLPAARRWPGRTCPPARRGRPCRKGVMTRRLVGALAPPVPQWTISSPF